MQPYKQDGALKLELWACFTGIKTFKKRLVYTIRVMASAQNNFASSCTTMAQKFKVDFCKCAFVAMHSLMTSLSSCDFL